MRIIKISLFLFSVFSLASCTSGKLGTINSPNQRTPVVGSRTDLAEVQPNQRYVVTEPIGVQSSNSIVGKFNARMIFLADQVERNVDRKTLANTFIVTSFTNLNKLSETTPFGRLVAENLIHELQVRKWQVFEVRLTKDIVINEAGEFSLSRDIKKLRDQYNIGGIVTGTYSVADGHIVLNARVIDINTGLVVSTGQIHIPSNWYTDALLYNEDNMKAMKVVGDTPYSCREVGTCTSSDPVPPVKINGGVR